MSEAARRLDGDLCDLADIADPGAKGFVVRDADDLPMKVFVVRRGQVVRGYVNRCPHNRIPLDFMPDDFLNMGKTHIQCATHGAIFLMEDGLCVEGPCRGRRLDAFPVTLVNGRVLTDSP
ncbi:Rieske (2Fe-2S) protein [Rhodospirillum sp. A1_3_36]|uniref:Rieske (2Fe-2S) protein n=1 Tax=Rhodospirillum sp. A1_3_36 TaxID=3391666 RepID=UPI0039A47F31